MITAIVVGVIGVGILAAVVNGEFWTALIGLAIVAGILYVRHEGRRADLAYMNCIDYWAEGGPNQSRK